jgi:biotin operon repressor
MKNTTPDFIVAFRGEARRKGFSQIPNVITLDKSLSCPAYRLYSLLVSYAMQASGSIASQGAMAEDLGVTDRSVRNWIEELKEHGLISVEQQGHMKPNLYIIEDAYALYDTKKPKQGISKQVSPEPSFRSSEESSFRSYRNGDSGHGGTAVPALNKKQENKKEKQPDVSALLVSGLKTDEQLRVAKLGAKKLKEAIDAAMKGH